MKKQNYEIKTEKIRAAFLELKMKQPEKLKTRLNLSWSNWGFGIEPLEVSAARLQKNGIQFIELHGNHYGPDLGYKVGETKKILGATASRWAASAACSRPTTTCPATARSTGRRRWTT